MQIKKKWIAMHSMSLQCAGVHKIRKAISFRDDVFFGWWKFGNGRKSSPNTFYTDNRGKINSTDMQKERRKGGPPFMLRGWMEVPIQPPQKTNADQAEAEIYYCSSPFIRRPTAFCGKEGILCEPAVAYQILNIVCVLKTSAAVSEEFPIFSEEVFTFPGIFPRKKQYKDRCLF